MGAYGLSRSSPATRLIKPKKGQTKKKIKEMNTSFSLAATLCRGTGPFLAAESWQGLPRTVIPQPTKQPCHQGVVLDAGGRCHIRPCAAEIACKRLFQRFAAALGKEPSAALLLRGKASSQVNFGAQGGTLPSCGTGVLPGWERGGCLHGRGRWGFPSSRDQPCPFPGLAPRAKESPAVPRATESCHRTSWGIALTPQRCTVLAHQPVAGAPSGSIPLGEILLDLPPADTA